MDRCYSITRKGEQCKLKYKNNEFFYHVHRDNVYFGNINTIFINNKCINFDPINLRKALLILKNISRICKKNNHSFDYKSIKYKNNISLSFFDKIKKFIKII